jgi:ribosomal protein S18 acetylase RimI-like enzyme
MIIRKYIDSDRIRVVELLKLNTPQYFSPTEEEGLIDYLNNHADNFYVLEIENNIICCGGFNFAEDPEIVRISWGIVDPKFQGKGFGSELTRFRINKMKEIPGVKILSVRTSQMTYKFYEKFGFKVREIAKDFWADGYDMYRMDMNKEDTL